MKGLRLSESLTLPIDAVTQTFACIGRRGAGKTYLAGLLAEQMIDAGAQIIILDPVGNWWGLRVNADGKSEGKEIFVIGGAHGDVPISPDVGARLARLLVQRPVCAILDTSEFREGERKRFSADFATEFFHLKKQQKSAVHLFIEEAQLFIPQHPRPARGESFSEAEMLGAFERIIRLGRNYGIGATLITQRPQSVNKEVLSQTECLCALQVNGRHEREALQKWVEEHGATDRALVGDLPGLPQGEGFVWSPSWLRIFERMRFAKKTTFDASATPKVGATIKATVLSKLDVASLRADLKEVISRAEEDDPKKLRQRIAELEIKLNAPVAPAQVERIDRESLLNAQREEIERIVTEQFRPKFVHAFDALEKFHRSILDPNSWKVTLSKPAQAAIKNSIVVDSRLAAASPAPVPKAPRKPLNGRVLPGPEQRILDAIAWFHAIGVPDPEQAAVAFLAGYSIKSSSYNVPRSKLQRIRAVDYLADGRIRLTEEGLSLANVPSVPPSNQGLQQTILEKLPGPERRLLGPLIEAWPKAMTHQEVAAKAGYSHASSSYNVPRSRLKTFGLVEYPEPGKIRARALLFPLR